MRPTHRDWSPAKTARYFESGLEAADYEPPLYRCPSCSGAFFNRDSLDRHEARGCSWDALVAELREAM